MRTVYLVKANDDLISHCSCGDGRISFPAQMDCPWCGCGWLFTCMTCRRAFAFAEGVELETNWEELALEDIRNSWQSEPSEDDVASWVAAMKVILANVEPGKQYAILDGFVLSVDATAIEFEGWHAHHHLDSLPQIDALEDRSLLDTSIGSRGYWTSRALPKSEE
ncbi:MAG TPA: hypothetical protein DDY91_08330 [Planctomycetaceae bacterium]|nr:hypothetical protein [Planctomycetaceae bacterium]